MIAVPFSVAINRLPSAGTIYTLDTLTLTCVTTIPHSPAIDVPIEVIHQWRRHWNTLSNGSGVIISEVTSSTEVNTDGSGSGNGSGSGSGSRNNSIMYSSTLTYLSLHSSETGSHSCTSIVQVDENTEIAQPDMYDTADFIVEAGKLLSIM